MKKILDIDHILSRAKRARTEYIRKNKLEAWRLYDKEDPNLPLAIDIYQEYGVIFLFAAVDPDLLRGVEHYLRSKLHIRDVFYKDKTKENLAIKPGSEKNLTILEYGHRFFVNLSDYLDTGLFLDHRETRRFIETKSRGKIVLNTFAYTGSFSIYAGRGGAQKTHSVDLSSTYCDWIKKNLELNHLSPEKNWVYKMETFEFLKYARKKKLRFDIIIIDPPTFSRLQKKNFSVERDHARLINESLELLNLNGFILFSNNKRGFKLKKNELTPCRVQNFKRQTWPADFRDPETHHCFLIEAM